MDCDNVTLLAPADGFNKFFEGSNGYWNWFKIMKHIFDYFIPFKKHSCHISNPTRALSAVPQKNGFVKVMTCFFSVSSVTKNMKNWRRYDGELKPKMRRRDMQYGSKAQKRSDDVNELGLRHQKSPQNQTPVASFIENVGYKMWENRDTSPMRHTSGTAWRSLWAATELVPLGSPTAFFFEIIPIISSLPLNQNKRD